MRGTISVLCLMLPLPAVLSAQTQTRHPTVFVAGGFEAVGVGAPYERAYGLSLQAGYLHQYNRLALRIGATYFERNRTFANGGYARPRAIGTTLELSYDLTTSRLRPYVVGGWGLYRLTGSMLTSSGPYVVDQLSPAMIGGLGFRYRLGNAQVFTEARFHGFTNGQGWGSAFMPVTLGIRF